MENFNKINLENFKDAESSEIGDALTVALVDSLNKAIELHNLDSDGD